MSLLVHPKLQVPKEELSLKHFSDDVVTDHIFTKHRDDDTMKIDIDKYILLVESIIITADRITDSVSLVIGGLVPFASISYASLNLPLCTLHRISSELACKGPGIEKAHETTMEILEILKSYPWETKSVLTMAAFGTEYGDLWHLNHYSNSDPLAKTLGIIKQVPLLKKQLKSPKFRQVFLRPKCLIYNCLQAIKYMNEIRNISKYNDVKEVPELSSAIRQIPLITYWVIHVIVASRTQISGYFTGTEGQSLKYLNELTEKISSILIILENHLNIIREQQEEIELYRWLVDHVDNFPTEINLVVPKLIEGKIDAKPFIDGSTLRKVSIDNALRRKNVILVISGLNISDEDIKALQLIYNELKKEEKYKIIWIPIIKISKGLDQDNRNKYDYVRSKMPWYAVQYTTKIAGWRFLEEKWELRDDPLVVVLDSKSKVEFTNAIHLIRVWGTDAIPFTYRKTEILLRKTWPESTLVKFTDNPRSSTRSINQERSIIYYGGKDKKWIEQFEDRVKDIKNDGLIRNRGIKFEIVRIGKDDPTIMSHFWNTQWGYFIIKSQLKGSSAIETTEDILRLISYENENGWAVLAVGSSPLLVGRGSLVLTVLEKFDNWKKNLNVKGFLDSFRDYFNDLASRTHQCERVILPGFSGWIPMVVNCPECPRFMETGINFKCCHGQTTM